MVKRGGISQKFVLVSILLCLFFISGISLAFALSSLGLDWIYPTANLNVTQNEFFNMTVNVTCFTENCGEVNVTLDPATTPVSCKEILDLGQSTGSKNYSIYPYGNATPLDTYCDMTTEGGGWTLVSNMGTGVCAESLVMGGNELNDLTTVYFTNKLGVMNHTHWLLIHNNSGAFTHRIVMNFTSAKNLSARFADMVSTGETINWSATNATNATEAGTLTTHRFSDNAGITLGNWFTRTRLSSDDGTWGVINGATLNGDTPGPQLSGSSAPRYGFENANSADSVCNTFYAGSDSASSSDWDAHFFIRENVTYASLKSGTVSTNTSTTPFYTNVTNPFNVSLNAGESSTITWWVNATGTKDITHTFFAYANITDNQTIENQTASFNITVKDFTAPTVNITFPVNNTVYAIDVNQLNYTYSDFNGGGSCWYTTDDGVTNSTSNDAGTNFTSVTSTGGKNTWKVYCNDSLGNVGAGAVNFTKTLPQMKVSLITPLTDLNASQNRSFTVTVNVTCENNDCGEVNVTLDPAATPVSCKEIIDTGKSTGNGTYVIYPFGNGSFIHVYCDMSTEGGGWTLVFGSKGSTTTFGSTWAGWYSSGNNIVNLTDNNTEGKSKAFDAVNFTDVMLRSTFDADGNIFANLGQVYPSLVNFTGPNPGSNNGNATWDSGLRGNFSAYNRSGDHFENDWIAVWHGDGSSDANDRVVFSTSALSGSDWGGNNNRGSIGGEFRTSRNDANWYYVYVRDNSSYGGSVKGGIVSSNTSATPYYVNMSNPYNISLNQSTYTTVSWKVNATGALNGTHEFYVYINRTGDPSNGNITARWNVSIVVPPNDTTNPTATQNAPASPYTNDIFNRINLTFNCSITDDLGLTNVSLFLTTPTNESFGLNLSSTIDGTSVTQNWTVELGNGSYTWNCFAYDTAKNNDWGTNQSVVITLRDSDNDNLPDRDDMLEGNESHVNITGIDSLNITVGGAQITTVYTGVQDVAFYDGATLLMNFSHNFSATEFDLNKSRIIKETNGVLVNLSEQLQSAHTKTLYTRDNNFVSLCVEDDEITAINNITAGCIGDNETDFSSCIGSSAGVTVDGITCTDLGDTFKIENLRYSGARGVPETSGGKGAAAGGGGGGGGGGSSCIRDDQCYQGQICENRKCVKPQCVIDADCPGTALCKKNKCVTYECTQNADCNTAVGESCWLNQCVKLFDIVILEFDSPVPVGDFFNFEYLMKGMANISGDVIVNFAVEQDSSVIASGHDTIYIGNYEEKILQSKLFLPSDVQSGRYVFSIELVYGDYKANTHRTMEISVEEETQTAIIQIAGSTPVPQKSGFSFGKALVILFVLLALAGVYVKREHIIHGTINAIDLYNNRQNKKSQSRSSREIQEHLKAKFYPLHKIEEENAVTSLMREPIKHNSEVYSTRFVSQQASSSSAESTPSPAQPTQQPAVEQTSSTTQPTPLPEPKTQTPKPGVLVEGWKKENWINTYIESVRVEVPQGTRAIMIDKQPLDLYDPEIASRDPGLPDMNIIKGLTQYVFTVESTLDRPRIALTSDGRIFYNKKLFQGTPEEIHYFMGKFKQEYADFDHSNYNNQNI